MKVYAVMRDNSCNYDEDERGVTVSQLFMEKATAEFCVSGKKMFQRKDDQTSYYVREMNVQEGDDEDYLATAGLGPKAKKNLPKFETEEIEISFPKKKKKDIHAKSNAAIGRYQAKKKA